MTFSKSFLHFFQLDEWVGVLTKKIDELYWLADFLPPPSPRVPAGKEIHNFATDLQRYPLGLVTSGFASLFKKEFPSTEVASVLAPELVAFIFGPSWCLPKQPHGYSMAPIVMSGPSDLCGSHLG